MNETTKLIRKSTYSVYSISATNKNSDFSSFLHIVCGIAGTGILQLPFALKQGGWITLVFVLIVSYLLYFSGILISKCMNHDPFNKLNGFMEIANHLFGFKGKLFYQICNGSLMLGTCALYLILSTINLHLLFPTIQLNWIIICTLFSCAPFILMKSLKEATILSFFGVLSTFVMVIIILYVSAKHFISLDLYPTYKYLDIKYIPIASASISFSLSGNNIFPQIEASMEQPKNFKNVLFYACSTVSVLFIAVAGIAYLAYGENSSSPIFNNMQMGIEVFVAILMLTLHMIVTIPIYLTTFSIDLEESFKIHLMNPQKEKWSRYIIRILIVLFIFLIALTLPYFSQIVSLIGALFSSLLIFFIPPMFYLNFYRWSRINIFDKLTICFLLSFGSIVILIGTYQSLVNLYVSMS